MFRSGPDGLAIRLVPISLLLIAALLVPVTTRSASDDGTWVEMFSQEQYGHIGVHDAAHDRMLVIGSKVMALPLSGTPTWTELTTTGTTPRHKPRSTIRARARCHLRISFRGVDAFADGNTVLDAGHTQWYSTSFLQRTGCDLRSGARSHARIHTTRRRLATPSVRRSCVDKACD
jgi:hypothetical protein